jgi:hypothetical protein
MLCSVHHRCDTEHEEVPLTAKPTIFLFFLLSAVGPSPLPLFSSQEKTLCGHNCAMCMLCESSGNGIRDSFSAFLVRTLTREKKKRGRTLSCSAPAQLLSTNPALFRLPLDAQSNLFDCEEGEKYTVPLVLPSTGIASRNSSCPAMKAIGTS